MEKEQTNNIREEKRTSTNRPYVINYIATFVFYVISAVLYYVFEENKDGVLMMSAIFAICQSLEFWLIFLVYKYLLKNTKLMRLYKIIMVILLLLAFFNFAGSVKYSPHYFLIMAIIVTVISLTIQNLIITKKVHS